MTTKKSEACLMMAAGRARVDEGPNPAWRRRAQWVVGVAIPAPRELGNAALMEEDHGILIYLEHGREFVRKSMHEKPK